MESTKSLRMSELHEIMKFFFELSEYEYEYAFNEKLDSYLLRVKLTVPEKVREIYLWIIVQEDAILFEFSPAIYIDVEDEEVLRTISEFFFWINNEEIKGGFGVDDTGAILYYTCLDIKNDQLSSNELIKLINKNVDYGIKAFNDNMEGIIGIVFYNMSVEEAIEACDNRRLKLFEKLMNKVENFRDILNGKRQEKSAEEMRKEKENFLLLFDYFFRNFPDLRKQLQSREFMDVLNRYILNDVIDMINSKNLEE